MRQQAILIKLVEGETFAELFKDLKVKIRPDDLNAEMTAVKKRLSDTSYFCSTVRLRIVCSSVKQSKEL